MATTMVALATASVVSEAWATAMAPVMAWEAMEVMAAATSVPLSMEDACPLDFSENTVLLQRSVSLIQNSSPRQHIFTPAMLLT